MIISNIISSFCMLYYSHLFPSITSLSPISLFYTHLFLSSFSPSHSIINIFVPYSITYHNWYSLCVSRSLSITTESTSATPEYLLSCLLSGAYYLPQESLLRTQSSGGRNFINNVASLFDY